MQNKELIIAQCLAQDLDTEFDIEMNEAFIRGTKYNLIAFNPLPILPEIEPNLRLLLYSLPLEITREDEQKELDLLKANIKKEIDDMDGFNNYTILIDNPHQIILTISYEY